MADKSKKNYYQINKEDRLKYQREYYRRNKETIKRRRELKLAENPELVDEQKEYNKKYYIENKERIKTKRAVTKKRAAQKKEDSLNKWS